MVRLASPPRAPAAPGPTRALGGRGSARRSAAAALLALVVLACGIAPEPVHLGSDECAQCRMTISEPQYASQVLSARGRSYKFDSIECMVSFLSGSQLAASDVHSAWVADFDSPENWVPAEEAVFVHSSRLRSPMGGGLSGHGTPAGAEALLGELGAGELLDWAALRRRDVSHDHGAAAEASGEDGVQQAGAGHAH